MSKIKPHVQQYTKSPIPKGLDRMIGTVFTSRNIKKTTVYITRNKHVQSVIFRQTQQRTIINSSKKSQMYHTNRV